MIIGICGKAGAGKDTTADFLVRDHKFVKVALADPLKRICKEVFDFSDEQLWGPSEKRNEPDKRYLRLRAGAHGASDVRALVGRENCEKKQCPPGTFDKYTIKGMEHLVTSWDGVYGFLPFPPKDEYLTPRYALQQLGTQWGRNCYSNVWVDLALRVAKNLLSNNELMYTQKDGIIYPRPEWRHDRDYVPHGVYRKGVVIPDVRFGNEIDAIKEAGGFVIRIDRPGAGLQGEASQHVSETEQDGIEDDEFDAIIKNDGSLEELEKKTADFLLAFVNEAEK